MGVLPALLAGLATAQQPPPPLAPVLPFDLPHAVPHGLELLPPPGAGRWRLALTTAYGNTFSGTHQVARSHLAVDDPGTPLSPGALACAELNWPNDVFYLLDTEVVRLELEAARGLGHGWSAGARLPWWRLGGTGLDSLPQQVHRTLGIAAPGRELYPDGQSLVVVRIPGRGSVVLSSEERRLGNLTAWFARDLPPTGRLRHRLRVSVSAPTAGTTPLGAPGWDVGLGWDGELDLGRVTVEGGLAWTRQGGTTVLGEDAADTWHTWGSLTLPVTSRLGAGFIARLDSSPLRNAEAGRLGDPRATFALGPTFQLSPSLLLQLALGEDVPGVGVTPDFSVQTRLLWRGDSS